MKGFFRAFLLVCTVVIYAAAAAPTQGVWAGSTKLLPEMGGDTDIIFQQELHLAPGSSTGQWTIPVTNSEGQVFWFLGVQAEDTVGALFSVHCDSTKLDPMVSIPWTPVSENPDIIAMETQVPAGFQGEVIVRFQPGAMVQELTGQRAIFKILRTKPKRIN